MCLTELLGSFMSLVGKLFTVSEEINVWIQNTAL